MRAWQRCDQVAGSLDDFDSLASSLMGLSPAQMEALCPGGHAHKTAVTCVSPYTLRSVVQAIAQQAPSTIMCREPNPTNFGPCLRREARSACSSTCRSSRRAWRTAASTLLATSSPQQVTTEHATDVATACVQVGSRCLVCPACGGRAAAALRPHAAAVWWQTRHNLNHHKPHQHVEA